MTTATAWQSTLEQEHAAVYGYGLIGGQLGPDSVLARTGLELHRARRDQCAAAIVQLGELPVAARPAYDPVTPVTGPASARQLAAAIERDCAARYAELAAQPDVPTRMFGAQWLRVSAIQSTRWTSQIPALPGIES